MTKLNVIQGTTCFAEHQRLGLTCLKETCRHHHTMPTYLNCSIIAANMDPQGDTCRQSPNGKRHMTLHEIGMQHDMGRARILQIVNDVLGRIRRDHF